MKTHVCRFVYPLLAGALVSFLSTGSLISQTLKVTTEELTRKADVVAVGRVTGTKGEWDQTRSRIVTRVTMAVGEYLKGSAGSVMTITSPGGEVDGIGEWYSHTARFAKDEEVVVFAERDMKGGYRVAGGHQGKFAIKKGGGTSKARVSELMTLDDLKSHIKHALTVQEGK